MNHLFTWENYADFAVQRGELALYVVQQHIPVPNAQVLDLGCGEGGTSLAFARAGANVSATDIRTDFRHHHTAINYYRCSADQLPFRDRLFDIIILQDVWEHLSNHNSVLTEMNRVMKPDGCLYISTPNRLSPLNFMSDPHWHTPVVSVLPRRQVQWVIQRILKLDTRDRKDWAELSSLASLKRQLHRNNFNITFHNRDAVKLMFARPETIVCRPLHFRLIERAKSCKMDEVITRIVNDRPGIFNAFINPTWYIVGRKNKI